MPTFQFLGCVVGGEGEDMDEEKEKKKFLYDGELFYKNISCRKFLVLLFPPVYLISLESNKKQNLVSNTHEF